MPKILLLGKDGQVGWELRRSLAPLGEVVALGRTDGGDLSDLDALAAMVRRVHPGAIVNAAAYTAVDRAETETELAFRINGDAPGVLARQAARLDVPMVHYSTDYVFDGSGSEARDETAPTAPLSVYGRSKLAGEEQIRASGCRHLIFRTSWVYGLHGQNFARTILRSAATRTELRVIDDQVGAPTGAELIADVTALALYRVSPMPDLQGLFNLAPRGEVSWFGYARFLVGEAIRRGLSFKLALEGIQPITTAEYPTTALRPANSRLKPSRLESAFGLQMPHWKDGIYRLLDEAGTRWALR
jgi:dTDP-4-dehydrorhamnose reductase